MNVRYLLRSDSVRDYGMCCDHISILVSKGKMSTKMATPTLAG